MNQNDSDSEEYVDDEYVPEESASASEEIEDSEPESDSEKSEDEEVIDDLIEDEEDEKPSEEKLSREKQLWNEFMADVNRINSRTPTVEQSFAPEPIHISNANVVQNIIPITNNEISLVQNVIPINQNAIPIAQNLVSAVQNTTNVNPNQTIFLIPANKVNNNNSVSQVLSNIKSMSAGIKRPASNLIINSQSSSTSYMPQLKKPALGGLVGSTSNPLQNLLVKNKEKKLNTLQQAQESWNKFVSDEGIQDDIKIHNRGKNGYLEKKAFQERTEMMQYELQREMRMKTKKPQ